MPRRVMRRGAEAMASVVARLVVLAPLLIALAACAPLYRPVTAASESSVARLSQGPLTAAPGDAGRGRTIALSQERGNCVLCHAFPESGLRFSGDIGPPLHGVGARFREDQLRFRLVDGSRLNAGTVMPAYHRVQGLTRVAPAYQGKTLLSPQEIEDVVAYLASLK